MDVPNVRVENEIAGGRSGSRKNEQEEETSVSHERKATRTGSRAELPAGEVFSIGSERTNLAGSTQYRRSVTSLCLPRSFSHNHSTNIPSLGTPDTNTLPLQIWCPNGGSQDEAADIPQRLPRGAFLAQLTQQVGE